MVQTVVMKLVRGNTATIVIPLRERQPGSALAAHDLTAYTTMTVTGDTQENPTDTSTRLFTKTVTTSGFAAPANGDMEFAFTDADWTSGALTTLTPGTYHIDIWGTDGSSNDKPLVKGLFDFVMDLSKLNP